MNRIALALDLGGTNLRLAAVGEDGTIYSRSRAETPKGSSGNDVIDLIIHLAEHCRSGLEDPSAVCAIAAAVPATINIDEGILNKLPNLRCLEGVPLRDILSNRLGVDAVLENDATAAAIGENWLGASRDVDTSICVTLGTGVGGGLMINGKPYRGKDGTAGEVGHICVEPDGHPCGCGSRGCVEQYASATAVIRMAREAGLDVSTSSDVYNWAKRGNEEAVDVFTAMGTYLGIGLAGLVNVLNPEMIVIGGGVSAAWELFAGDVRREVDERSFPEPAKRVKIVGAELGDDAGILGAARAVFALISK
ncbi:MAG TPA: ROK family protein [Pyrinomonadaceae bacterium]|nr:ROK family protein [Pyrinomonadaceae bacterium]